MGIGNRGNHQPQGYVHYGYCTSTGDADVDADAEMLACCHNTAVFLYFMGFS